jgi:hypothetical protein
MPRAESSRRPRTRRGLAAIFARTFGAGLATLALAAAALACGGVAPAAAADLPTYSIPGGFFDHPVTYRSAEDHFKYGSLGGERGYKGQLGFGLPYWLWVALPELFSDLLPDKTPGRGFASFGYIYEAGRDPRFDLPIGISQRRTLGIDRVWLNCAVCHTGTVRDSEQSPPQVVLGMPANRYNQGAWAAFLFATARDPRFTPDRLLAAIRQLEKDRRQLVAAGKIAEAARLPRELNALDEAIFRHFVIDIMKRRLRQLGDRLWFIHLDSWGPGRVDTFNSPKALLNFPMQRARDEEKIGNADLPSVWYQEARKGMQLHWDGNNTSLDERNLSASFAAAIPPTLDKCSLLRTRDFLLSLAPPRFPEARIDQTLLARGERLYGDYCAQCHGAPKPPFKDAQRGIGEYVGTVISIDRIGTDRWRLDSYTPELVRAQNSLFAGYPLRGSQECPGDPGAKEYPARFTHFRKTNGYAASPLDGLWLRAPYLHNGSVPNLRALLEPAGERPKHFYIGYDVYDYDNVGFVTAGAAAQAGGWPYDTTAPGNGNRGHEGSCRGADPRYGCYGTDLAPDEKNALIEYLKTF